MKLYLKTVFALILLLSLSGCFQMDVLVKVSPDGSGTLEQTVLMRKDVIKQMKAMAQAFPGDAEGQPQEEFSLLDEEELKASAGNMGKEVTFVRAEPYETGDYEGYKAVFSFKDINTLNIDQNPGGNLPSDEGEEKAPEFITFDLKKGKTADLTIVMPENEKTKTDKDSTTSSEEKVVPKEATDPQQEEMMMGMMKEMMSGRRFSIAVEVDGKIEKTNATFRDGSRLTLMDMDFDKLLSAEEEFKKFAKSNPEKMSNAKELMKSIPGIKIETESKITVKFK